MGHGDVYLHPNAPDPVLPDAVVLEIARAHTKLSTSQVEVDESGGEARAYLLGGVVVKTQRPHRLRPRTSLAKEALLLRTLVEPLGHLVPHLYGHGYADAAQGVVEYVVMSRIPGDALVRRPANDAQRSALIGQMGELLLACPKSHHSCRAVSPCRSIAMAPTRPGGSSHASVTSRT